jgi:hypothetical protein
MRSGSSLLTHLLITNPDIIGYGETHIQYNSEADFKRLMCQAYWYSQEFRKVEHLQNLRMNHKYILDKVLHDNKFTNEDFLKSENIYVIFLLREPDRTLASMLDQKPHWQESDAVSYYNKRLASLIRYAQIINDPARTLLTTYEQIVNESNRVFTGLHSFLDTSQGFSEEYKILKSTGMRGVGDFKENIKAGHIVRKKRDLNIELSPEALETTQAQYQQCFSSLAQACQTM